MPSFSPTGSSGRHNARLKAPSKAKDVQGTLRRLLGYLGGQWGIIAIVLAASLISTVITVVGTRLNGVAVDRYILVGDLRGLALLCLIMLAIYVVNIAATYVQNILMIDVAQRTSATLRSDLFRSILHLPQAYFDQHASGDLMSRLTNDVDNVNSTLSQSVTQLFSGIISIGGMLLAMLLLSPLLTLFAMIVVPMMMVVPRSIIKRSRRYFSALQRELGELNGYIEEMISGQKAVLLFQQEEAVAAEFDAMNSRLQTSYTLAQTFSAMGPFMSFINNITYVVVTLVGAMLILRGSLSVGVVFTFLLYMRNFSRPLNSLAALFNTIQSALAGAERVFEVIDEPPESDEISAAMSWRTMFPLPTGRNWCSKTPVSTSKPVRPSPLSALPVQARPRSSACSTVSTIRLAALSPLTVRISADSPVTACGERSAWCCRIPSCSPNPSQTIFATAAWTLPTKKWCAPRKWPMHTASSCRWPTATIPS